VRVKGILRLIGNGTYKGLLRQSDMLILSLALFADIAPNPFTAGIDR